MKNVLVYVSFIFIFTACSSLNVTVDYDTDFDFMTKKSFAVVHQNKVAEDTLFNDRVIAALESELTMKAYSKSEKESADLIFVFHANVESKTDIDTDYTMIGYGRYTYGGYMVATTRAHRYEKGTLIVDALNPVDSKIVWRGIATDILKKHKTPQERTAYVNEVIKKTMQNFPSRAELK